MLWLQLSRFNRIKELKIDGVVFRYYGWNLLGVDVKNEIREILNMSITFLKQTSVLGEEKS